MTACILIIFTIYLGFVLFLSHGFEVIQPRNRTVNPDRSASISCEHNANVQSIEDVRLNSISPTDKRSLLCQKGMKNCTNIVMYPENANKCLFIIFNIGEEAMNMLYECEFTVKTEDIDDTKKGRPTKLLPVQRESKEDNVFHCPPPALSHLFWWILIGLLALMFVYSCIMTCFYIRLRSSSSDLENSTYMEMRKGPLPRNAAYDMYCG